MSRCLSGPSPLPGRMRASSEGGFSVCCCCCCSPADLAACAHCNIEATCSSLTHSLHRHAAPITHNPAHTQDQQGRPEHHSDVSQAGRRRHQQPAGEPHLQGVLGDAQEHAAAGCCSVLCWWEQTSTAGAKRMRMMQAAARLHDCTTAGSGTVQLVQ